MDSTDLLLELIAFIKNKYGKNVDINELLEGEIHNIFEKNEVKYSELFNDLQNNGSKDILDFLVIIETVQEVILTNEYGVAKSQLTLSASYVIDLGFDSLDIAELMMEYELTFRKSIPVQDSDKLLTILNSANYIFSKTKKGEIKL